MSKYSLVFGLLIVGLLASRAEAQTCTSYPNTLTNGTTADATQVMANFNCAALLGATSNSFSGNASFGGTLSVTGTSSFTGNASLAGNATIAGDLGIGTTSPTSPLQIVATNGASTGTYYGIYLSGQQTAADTGDYYAIGVNPTYTSSGTLAELYGSRFIPENTSTSGTVSTLAGIVGEPENTSGGTVSNEYGLFAVPQNTGAGTVTTMKAVYAEPMDTSSDTTSASVGAMYGVYSVPTLAGSSATTVTTMEALYGNCANTNSHGGTVGTCYELFLDTPTTTGTISTIYGVYQTDGSINNYFAGNIGIGTTAPSQALEVNGEVKVDSFGSATSTAVCESGGVLSTCSSSIRYKENVKDAQFGLDDVMQMRPVTFKWKGRDENDFGLIAEEVAKIDPLFVTYEKGKIEGVKYGQLTAVLVGAIKQLKAANDEESKEIAQLQTRLTELQQKSDAQSASVKELSPLKTENAMLKASLIAIDRRLSALETKSTTRNAATDYPRVHPSGTKKGG